MRYTITTNTTTTQITSDRKAKNVLGANEIKTREQIFSRATRKILNRKVKPNPDGEESVERVAKEKSVEKC